MEALSASENHSKVDFQTQLLFFPQNMHKSFHIQSHLVKSSEIVIDFGPIVAKNYYFLLEKWKVQLKTF